MTRPLIVIVALLLVVPCVASVPDALVMDPDEYRVVSEPAVAIADDGSMVVVWASRVDEGAEPLNGIRIRRFGGDGRPVGDIFRIDVLPGDLARKPSVDIAPDGSRFVVVWEGGTEDERKRRRIWARVFDADGRPLEVEFRVDRRRMTHEMWGLPRGYYRDPKVSMAPNGDFVVVWRTEGNTSCDRFNISARRYSRDGVALGDEFIVNADREWSQVNPAVDHDAAGGFVVVWQSGRWIGTDWEESRVIARRFDAEGRSMGDERALSRKGVRAAAQPALVVAPNGAFGCAWKRGNGDEPLSEIVAGAFDPTGHLLGRLIEIEPDVPGTGGPFATIVGQLDLMVAWNGSTIEPLTTPAVIAQIFDATGVPRTEPFPLSPATCWSVEAPQVAGSRGFGAVVWKSPTHDRILARRYAQSDPRLDVPLVGGGRRFADLVAESRHQLGHEAAQRLLCLRGSARPAFDDLMRCAMRTEGVVGSLCCWGVAVAAETPVRAVSALLEIVRFREFGWGNTAAAACTLGSFEKNASVAVPDLQDLLYEESSHLRACATMSLGRVGSYPSVDGMASALLGPQSTWRSPEVFSLYVRGLAELGESSHARWAVGRFRDALRWQTAFPDAQGEDWLYLDETQRLERYVRHSLEQRRIEEPRMVNWTVDQALDRYSEGWIDAGDYSWRPDENPGYDDIDVMLTRFVAVDNLGPMKECDGSLALVHGLSQLDPMPKWAFEMIDRLVQWKTESACLWEILETIERMGPRGAPFAENVAGLLRGADGSLLDLIRIMKALNPGCEPCVVQLRELLGHPNREVAAAAVDALISAGPDAVERCQPALEEMLKDRSADIRHRAERALDILEIEAAICDHGWTRAVPPPPVNSPVPPGVGWAPGGSPGMPPRPVRTLPAGSAVPPRAVRTPVPGSGYTGKPKKPG